MPSDIDKIIKSIFELKQPFHTEVCGATFSELEIVLRKQNRVAIFLLGDRSFENWNDFSNQFEKAFNFPDYYGKNQDAFIDVMRDVVFREDIDIVVLMTKSKSFQNKNKGRFLESALNLLQIVSQEWQQEQDLGAGWKRSAKGLYLVSQKFQPVGR